MIRTRASQTQQRQRTSLDTSFVHQLQLLPFGPATYASEHRIEIVELISLANRLRR
jgi:hypothetical protein